MQKHVLNWIACPTEPSHGIPWNAASKQIDLNYRGTLLSRILAMERKTPISFEDAIAIMEKFEDSARKAGRKGADPGHLFWYSFHFVEFIASLGYHIELSGDEFEPYQVIRTI